MLIIYFTRPRRRRRVLYMERVAITTFRDHVQGLQARAADKPAKDKARAAVPHLFLLNNLHYISSTIRSGFQEEQEMQNAEVSGTEQHGLQGRHICV